MGWGNISGVATGTYGARGDAGGAGEIASVALLGMA